MDLIRQVDLDFERFKGGLPVPLEGYVLETYGISLASVYGKHPIKNAFGKASGQLSLNAHQIEKDVDAGLGFIVLKTLIAQDPTGERSMAEWATQDTHMSVEEIAGTRPEVKGESGYTVTWKGRGWGDSFEKYLQLFDQALTAGRKKTLIVPSCKYNLPTPEESSWKTSEYSYTNARLQEVWQRHFTHAMPLEKDFSPTLAGNDDFSSEKANIMRWLSNVANIIRENTEDVSLGIKLFNARFEDEFQMEMLRSVAATGPDVLIYCNRLFDAAKSFEGTRGVAYGGPDLSARNIWALETSRKNGLRMQVSATGNIVTGRIMFDYLKAGCSSFQMHTLFQLPDRHFDWRGRNKTERALHHLLFNPQTGFLKYILREKELLGWPDGITIGAIAEYYRDSYQPHYV